MKRIMHRKISLDCDICKKSFLRQRSNNKTTKTGKVFCSRDCFSKFQKGRNTNPGRIYKKNKYILIACKYCSQPIYRWNYRLKQNKHHFCNIECKGRWTSLHLIGEKAVNWKGGLNYLAHKILTNPRYLRIREQVLTRDNYECALCQANIKLEVHHIIEKRENLLLAFDSNNMITLCKKCHISIRGKEKNYIGFFDGIVEKRMNSGKPRNGNPEPSVQSTKVQRLLGHSDMLNNQNSVRPERDEIVQVR